MRKISILTLLADLIWIPSALAVAHWVHEKHAHIIGHDFIGTYAYVAIVAVFVWVGLQSRLTIEGSRACWHLPAMMSQITVSTAFLVLTMLATAFMTKEMLSREVLVINGAMLFAGFIGIRLIARALVKMRAEHGGRRRTVILGGGDVARELACKLEKHHELMLQVVGFLSPTGTTIGNPGAGVHESMSSLDALTLLRKEGVAEVLVAQPEVPVAETKQVIGACRKLGMAVRVIPQFYELYLTRTTMVEVEGVPLLLLDGPMFSSAANLIKRLIDVVLGSSLLIAASPVIGIAALYIRLKGRQAFLREVRCGIRGSVFDMYRLNLVRDDSNLDVMERLLEFSSATELPQLVNVLKGEMSLVGPRPEHPHRVRSYSEWQGQRLSVKPGITGLAQVYGLRESDPSCAKANYDLEYILNWSAGGDISLIVQTAWTLLLRIVKVGSRRRGEAVDIPMAAKVRVQLAKTLDANAGDNSMGATRVANADSA